MARYITQQLFNMCAVSATKISAASGKPVAAVAQQLAATYSDSYKDTELAQDIAVAAEQVATFIGKSTTARHIDWNPHSIAVLYQALPTERKALANEAVRWNAVQ